MMKKEILGIVLMCTIVLSGCSSTNNSSNLNNSKGVLGKCLTEKGAIFYGTERCPHCKKQKSKFDNQMSTVPYIDCDKNKLKCTEAGISGYPTRVFADKSTLVGPQELTTLAKKAGCTYKE